MDSPEVESARRDWERGFALLQEAAEDRVSADRLHAQVEAILAELRRRVGGTFTLEELTREYSHAERWARHVVADEAASPGWPRSLAVAQDAAFHLYARGAQDYAP
jgi:hypothetical protein